MFTLRLEDDCVAPAVAREHARVQVWRDLGEEICAYGYAGEGWWAMEWPGHATFRFGPAIGDGIVTAAAAPGARRARVEETFRRGVLPLALQATGYETLHASAIDTPAGVIAFCGERRAGKSTIAYALERRGFAQHADDTIVIAVEPGRIETVALPFAPRLREASAEFFHTTTKHPESHVQHARRPIAGIFVLHPDGDAGAPAPERLEGPAAFRALLAHAHCFDPTSPASQQRLVRNYLDIAAGVPVHRLVYAPGLDRLDALLDAILDRADVGREAAVSA